MQLKLSNINIRKKNCTAHIPTIYLVGFVKKFTLITACMSDHHMVGFSFVFIKLKKLIFCCCFACTWHCIFYKKIRSDTLLQFYELFFHLFRSCIFLQIKFSLWFIWSSSFFQNYDCGNVANDSWDMREFLFFDKIGSWMIDWAIYFLFSWICSI